MQNSATSPSLTRMLDRYPLWIRYNRIEQIGLHTMFMRFTCTAQNRRKPCKTIMQPRVWWPLYGHCHLTWRSQDWEYCCLPPPSATEGQLALSVQVDLASSSRIYLMFDEAPSVWRKIERCHFPCMSLRVVFFFSLFLSPLCFICCSWFSVTRKVIFLALRSADLKTQETIELWWVVVIHRWQGEPTDGSKGGWRFESLSLSIDVYICIYI